MRQETSRLNGIPASMPLPPLPLPLVQGPSDAGDGDGDGGDDSAASQPLRSASVYGYLT